MTNQAGASRRRGALDHRRARRLTGNELLSFDAVNVGDALPPLSLPPLTRTTLALYAGASGDHNPMHIDIDFARAAGMPDVFAHGMLSMAWLGAAADATGRRSATCASSACAFPR